MVLSIMYDLWGGLHHFISYIWPHEDASVLYQKNDFVDTIKRIHVHVSVCVLLGQYTG